MKTTTRVLAREHNLLSLVLDRFEGLIQHSRKFDELDAVEACCLLGFFERAVDGLHQDKEEGILFPILQRNASQRPHASFERLLDDHAEDRRRLELMRKTIEGAAYGDALSLDCFLVNAQAYLELQRLHLEHENRWLLPLVELSLTDEDDRWVCARFVEIENERGIRFVAVARAAAFPKREHGRSLAG